MAGTAVAVTAAEAAAVSELLSGATGRRVCKLPLSSSPTRLLLPSSLLPASLDAEPSRWLERGSAA